MTVRTLENGLRVVVVPCEAESVAVGVFVASGSRHETPATAGISHFIEHMLFKGTARRSALDITLAFEGRGGNFNACTGEESTCYYCHMPSECLDEALDILSDMYLHAKIGAKDFVREKAVIIEEIKMYADEPDAVAMENLQKNLFPGLQLGEPVAGTPESLRPLKPADLKRYIKSHYRPDNTVVVIAGAVAEDTLARSLRPFERLKSAPSRSVDGLESGGFRIPPVREYVVRRDVQQAQLALGYRTFGVSDPRKYALTVLDAVLGRGMSSRLFQEVREKRGLSYDIISRGQFFRDTGMFTIAAGLPADKCGAALAVIDRELEKVCSKRIGAAELRRTKEFMIGNFRLGHEKVESKMFFYGSTMLAFGRPVSPQEQIEGIRAVTAADVQAVAKAVFRPENRSVSWVLPKKGTSDDQ